MDRRFLNLVLHDLRSSIRSLHRMDLRNLFYNTAEIAEQAAQDQAKAKKTSKLRALEPLRGLLRKPPVISCRTNDFFALPSESRESTVMMADSSGHTMILDIDFNSIVPMERMAYGKGPNCVCFATPDHDPLNDDLDSRNFFVLDLVPGTSASSFEVLNYYGSCDLPSQPLVSSHGNWKWNWSWTTLPVPPFLDDPAYTNIKMCSSMLLGGSTICVSSMQEGIGTYTFDTARRLSEAEWSRAGSWVLPFCGKAEYVPGLKLWFALSDSTSSPHSISALDLPAMNLVESPPELRHTWEYLDLPVSPYRRQLVNLGSGKFCVVSFFWTSASNAVKAIIKDESAAFTGAVFTGLEARRCDGAEGSVRMIKHLSKRYRFQKYVIHCVF